MYLPTFQNLPGQRKEEILDVCLTEFALHDYQTASVSRIVRDLGIAKGSFYRYFKSKKDLYSYLVYYATELRMEHVNELFESQDGDFFTLFEEHIAMVIRFDLRYPLHSRFLHNTMQERNTDQPVNLSLQAKEMMLELLTPVLEKCRQRRIVRKDIDTTILAYTIVQVQTGVFDFLSIRYKLDSGKCVNDKQSSLPVPEKEILHIAKGFSKVLKHGLGEV